MSPANNNDHNVDGDESANNTIAAKAKARAHDMLAYSQRQVDRIVAPSTRQRAVDSATAFATKRPLLSVCQAGPSTPLYPKSLVRCAPYRIIH